MKYNKKGNSSISENRELWMQRLIIVAAMVLVLVGGPLSLECWGCGGGGEGGSYSFGGDEGLEGLTGPGGVTGPPNGGPTISRRSFYGYSWGPKFNFYTTATGDLGPRAGWSGQSLVEGTRHRRLEELGAGPHQAVRLLPAHAQLVRQGGDA